MKAIIFGMPWSQLIFWLVIVVTVAIIFVLLLRFLLNKKRKKVEQAAKEAEQAAKAIKEAKQAAEAAKEKKEAEDLKRGYRYEYSAFSPRKKRLISCNDEKIIIATEEKDNNELIFSLSRPLFNSNPQRVMKSINGVTEVNKLNDYQFLVKISPAAKEDETYQKISCLLFKELGKRYFWLNQKVAIKLHRLNKSQLLIAIPGFNMSSPGVHGDLLFMLNNISGEDEAYAEKDEIVLHIKNFGEKDLEEVKGVLKEYFIGGVEFIDDEIEQK